MTTAPIYRVGQETMNDIAGFNIHRGCLALVRRPATPTLDRVAAGPLSRVLVLEGVNNPDNVGGLFRSAAAFGIELVVLGPNTGDPLYRKAVRTSMAATLTVPFVRARTGPRRIADLRADGFSVVALTPALTAAPLEDIRPTAKLALLVGAEGDGLTRDALAAATLTARIAMTPAVDSLNVTTAASIAMYHCFAERRQVAAIPPETTARAPSRSSPTGDRPAPATGPGDVRRGWDETGKQQPALGIDTPRAELVRIGLNALVGIQLLRNRGIGLDRQHQSHLQAAAERGVFLRGLELETRRQIGRELQVGVEPQQRRRRHRPGPRLDLHQLGDLIGAKGRLAVAALLIDTEDADHLVGLLTPPARGMRRGRHLSAEGVGELAGFRMGVGHLQGHGVEGNRAREQPVLVGQRHRRMQPNGALGRLGHIRAQRRELIDVRQPRPGRRVHWRVAQQVGLDVERPQLDALKLARRIDPHALGERMRPPGK